jgi:hypothetical protein
MKEGIVKREIRLLIGNIEPNFDHMLSVIITKLLGGEYILFKRKNVTIKDRGRKVLEIIAHLKATYGKPIIAASAFWTKDTSFAKKAKLAGVSCYLDMPFKSEEFLEPFCRLLEIEPDGRN